MGDTLSTLASVTSFDAEGEQTDQNAFGYRTVVVCSYDPNDKQVYPAGIGEQHYTLINNDELIYTIRFQNTGNDTAFNIIIADTLSNHLDRSTFRPITSSHPMRYQCRRFWWSLILTIFYYPTAPPTSHEVTAI